MMVRLCQFTVFGIRVRFVFLVMLVRLSTLGTLGTLAALMALALSFSVRLATLGTLAAPVSLASTFSAAARIMVLVVTDATRRWNSPIDTCEKNIVQMPRLFIWLNVVVDLVETICRRDDHGEN